MLKLLSRGEQNQTDSHAEKQPASRAPTAESATLAELIKQERYGVIARAPSRWKGQSQCDKLLKEVADTIDQRFALVPEGYVSIPKTVVDYAGCPETDFETAPFLLDRHAITNAQYAKFVHSGGYENLGLWPEDMWPHLIDLKDLSGQPGPRFWHDGQYESRLASHPVTGICYYEASAYANWAGFGLPSEAEWQMAASWRLRSSAHVLRRYPWGDAMDTNKCNIWSSGIGKTVAVDKYAKGTTPNGVLQMVGNVWEWTSSDFDVVDKDGRAIVGDMLMKAIRGGAFDTYFACQATSHFRTGLACLNRSHNVGFRCAMHCAADSAAADPGDKEGAKDGFVSE